MFSGVGAIRKLGGAPASRGTFAWWKGTHKMENMRQMSPLLYYGSGLKYLGGEDKGRSDLGGPRACFPGKN